MRNATNLSGGLGDGARPEYCCIRSQPQNSPDSRLDGGFIMKERQNPRAAEP